MIWKNYQVTNSWFKTKYFVIFFIVKANTTFFIRLGFRDLEVVDRVNDAGTHVIMDTATVKIPVCDVCPAGSFVVF
jgi:hypothetical protein